MNSYKIYGNYIVLDAIGSGGNGEVFIAIDSSKPPSPSHLLAIKQGSGEALRNEARITLRLRQKNICSYKESFVLNNQFFFVRDYISGLSLRKILDLKMRSKKGFSLSESIFIISEIMNGLVYLHGFKDQESGFTSGIVHGDLTPSNIILSRQGFVKLIDFGISRSIIDYADASLHSEYATLTYISLRRLKSQKIARTDDIIAVGFMFWEMVTNTRYYGDMSGPEVVAEIERMRFRDPTKLNPHIPSAVSEFIKKCLSSDTVFGYSSVQAARDDLRKIEENYQMSGNFSAEQFWADLRNEFQNDYERLELKDKQLFEIGNKAILSKQNASAIREKNLSTLQKIIRKNFYAFKKWALTLRKEDIRLLRLSVYGSLLAMIVWFSVVRWTESASFRRIYAKVYPVAKKVQIVSNPPGARIFLKGLDTKLETPAGLNLDEAGPVNLVTLRLENYPAYSFTVSEKIKTVEVDLKAQSHTAEPIHK